MKIGAYLSKEKTNSLCLYFAFVLLMILAIGCKKNFHSDEISNYKLANYDISKTLFEDGRAYYPPKAAWVDFMAVDGESRFQYGTVWKNQAGDVHPPLYYAMLHTICSIFPGCFSKWFAGIINILSAVGTLFFVRKLVMLLTGDEKLKLLISIAFITSAGVLSSVTFLRMYILVMLEVTVLTYLILKKIEGGGVESKRKFYAELFICMVCGALTHYYFVLYAVLISIAYGLLLFFRKAWKEVGVFCMTQGLAAAVSIGIFPAMLFHVFSGYRGTESFDNLADSLLSGGIERIGSFLEKLNWELFGGIFTYIAVGMAVYLLVFGLQNHQTGDADERRKTGDKYFCILFAGIFYFLFVSFSAPYLVDRYMFPIYAIVLSVMLCLLGQWMKKNFAGYLYGMILLTAVVSVNGLRNSKWEYLYLPTEELLDAAREHGETDCLFIYESKIRMQRVFCEASQYHSITFLKEENLEELATMDLASRYELVVIVDSRDDEILDEIMDICPSLNTFERLGGHANTNSYYLHGRQE